MFEDIMLFVKLVKFGGFSAAAKQTGVLQPTLSRRLKKLENELKISLIKRGTKLFVVTEQGQQLYEQFKHHEINVLNRVDAVMKSASTITGTISIVLPMVFAYEIITPHLADFIENNPEITLNIFYEHADINLAKVNHDLAVMLGKPSSQNQKIKLLAKTKAILYCSPKYLVKNKLPQTLAALSQHKIIGVIDPRGIVIRDVPIYQAKTGKQCNFEHNLPTQISTNNFIHSDTIVKTGKIIGVGFEMLLKPRFEEGKMIHVLPAYQFGLDCEFYALIPQEGLKPGARIFLDFIEKCINNYLDK